jgi:hypothetical protein
MSAHTKEPREYVAEVEKQIGAARGRAPRCCASQCFLKLSDGEVASHLVDVGVARALGHQRWWWWVRTCYLCSRPWVKKRGVFALANRVVNFRLPSVLRPLCRTAFCTLLGVSTSTLQNHISKQSDTLEDPHGNADRAPHNITTSQQTTVLTRFVEAVAEAEGVPNPRFAFSRSTDDAPDIIENIIHLPPRLSLGALYSLYVRHLADAPELAVCQRVFDRLFKELPALQHIKLSQRSRGVCELCKDLRLSLQHCGSDGRIADVLEALRVHLHAAFVQRSLYQERTERSVDAWGSACRRLPVGMVSFDYASKVKVPSSTMQTQGEYMGEEFGLDVFLFGITNEGEKVYYNYFYEEGYNSGDSNTVISMLHQHLLSDARLNYCKQLYVYTDSCSGQNRNRYVYSYFINRILAGHHDEISWNFMVVGHTKFSPDRGFGLIRQALERFDAYTVPDLMRMTNQLGSDRSYNCRGMEAVVSEFRDYRSTISRPFKQLKGIKSLNIGEIIFRPAFVGEKRICRVFYKLVGWDEEVEVDVVSRGRTAEQRASHHDRFPAGEIISTDPPAKIPRKVFSYDRWAQLMEIIGRCVHVPEEAVEYFCAIPHQPYTQRCSRKERPDSVIGAVASVPSTSLADPISVTGDNEITQSQPAQSSVLPEKRPRTSGGDTRQSLIATAGDYVPRFLRDLPLERRSRRQSSATNTIN